MNNQAPCTEWEEQLAARHPEDLSSSQRAGLDAHMANCPACALTYTDYNFLTARIRALPEPGISPLPCFSPVVGQVEDYSEVHHFHSSFPIPTDAQARPKVRRSRFLQRVNMIAAVLIVGVLIGSSLLLFANRHMTAGSAKSSCTLWNSPNAPDWAYICAHHLYRDVHQTKSIEGYKLTLEQAYIDTNQMIISYSIIGPDKGNYYVVQVEGTTTTRQSIALPGKRGAGIAGLGTAWYDTQRHVLISDKSSFFAFTYNPLNTSTVQLHTQVNTVDINKAGLDSNGKPFPGIRLHGPVIFDFSVPFYPARIAEVHQTITIGKASVTLERVLVTPSMVHLFVHVQGVDLGNLEDEYLPFSLSVGGKNNFISYVSDLGFEHGIITSFEPFYRNPLYNEHGQWTFTITDPHGNGRAWVFHFVVP